MTGRENHPESRRRGAPWGRVLAGAAALVVCLLAALPHAVAQDSRTDPFWTPPVSEETPPAICRRGFAVKSILCEGRYCDNKSLFCERYTGSRELTRYSWSQQFSEEGNGAAAADDMLVTGIACKGRYCDNLSLQFGRSRTTERLTDCRWQNEWYSEEGLVEKDGRDRGRMSNEERAVRFVSCPGPSLVAGIQCRGSYCDNIRLYCCRLP